MTLKHKVRALLGALIMAQPATAIRAHADIKDYEFTLVTKEFRQGPAAIAVRLVNKNTGVAVPDAVIFASRLDMAPDGMPTMTSAVEALAPDEPGIYRLKTNLTMEGSWQLSLGAKVQGETGTLAEKLILRVLP